MTLSRAAALVALAAVGGSCAGSGQGTLAGEVHVPICALSGPYDLHPSFFGANRNGATLLMRIQNGGGATEYTDSLAITVDDTEAIERAVVASGGGSVTVPVGLRGEPGVNVHATLEPDKSCGRIRSTVFGENVGLWSDTVAPECGASTITFASVDNPGGTHAAGVDERFTNVTHVRLCLHDPRPVGADTAHNVSPDSPVGWAVLEGQFSFAFSHALPAINFP